MLKAQDAAAYDVIRQMRSELANTPAILGQTSIYGLRFQVKVKIRGLNGRERTLVTCWQIDNSKEIPRLITHWLEVDK